MTREQYGKVESKLIGAIEYISERAVSPDEAQALAAVVQSLVSLELARQSAQGDQ